MARFVLRVWLPDRPGALGRVASAIGSVGASLTGIDILEQGGGSAIDELLVEAVDSPNAIEKLVAALQLVDGVNVEDIRPAASAFVDARVDALFTAAELVEEETAQGLLDVLVGRVRHDVWADWVLVIGSESTSPRAAIGDGPSVPWVQAFLAGSRASRDHGAQHGPEDVAWTDLHKAELALVVGRSGRPFRERERQQLVALARIADRRLGEVR